MPLKNTVISNLFGGVSQQPAGIRLDNQCEELINAYPSIEDGLVKRPPTELIANLTAFVGYPEPPADPDLNTGNLLIADESNKRVVTRQKYDLSYVSEVGAIANPGPSHTHINSSDAGGFSAPRGLTVKGDYYYVGDAAFDLQKRRFSDHAYIGGIHIGDGNGALADAKIILDIACDGTYLYTINYSYPFVIKRRLSDLGYVAHFGNGAYYSAVHHDGMGGYTFGGRTTGFSFPSGIDTDGEFVFVGDTGNHRIVKLRCDTMAYVGDKGKIYQGITGFSGTGQGEFGGPAGLCVSNDSIVVAESGNHRIQQLSKDFVFEQMIGTQGSGDDQFYVPSNLDSDNTNLYILDAYNQRLQKRLCSDLSFVSKIGSSGHGDDNFGSGSQSQVVAVWKP